MRHFTLHPWTRLAFAAALLCALVLMVAPSLSYAQPPQPPSAATEDERPAAGALPAPASESVAPDRVAATLTVDGACVDADLDLVCDGLTNTYKTIQKAIDMATTGDTINVSAGTYMENVIVTKSLTLTGAGAATTTVLPATSGPKCTSGGGSICTGGVNLVAVRANDVVISAFTFDGDNPTLSSGVTVNGADLDARNGIITDHTAVSLVTGLEIHHVTVKNIYLRGIYASTTGGTFNIHDNSVENVDGEDASIGIFNFGGSGMVADNAVTLANDAIAANHSRGTQFLRNTITSSGSGVHSDNNGSGGGVADLLQGNIVSSCAANGYGVWTFASYLATTVDRNTITGCSVGLSVWGQSGTSAQQFTDNVVNGVVGSTGLYVTTDLISWGYADVSANFSGNVIDGNAEGVYFTADNQTWNPYAYEAKTITAAFSDNSVTNNVAQVIVDPDDADGVYNVNASGNWWGDADPADVKTAVNGGLFVDYTPWLAVGTDTSADPGFQGDFSVLWVDDDSPQTGTAGRIQEGIEFVTGSTVNVAAGTYTDSINIVGRAGLTINGVDRATVIVQPATTLCFDVGGYACGRRAAVRVVNSTNLTFQNLTFDFATVTGNNIIGLLLWDSTGTISNNMLRNMSLSDAAGYYYEITSYVRAPSYTAGSPAQVTFVGNSFVDTGRIGIVTHGYAHTTISGNTFHKDFNDFGYALEIGSTSTATITGNTIDGYDMPAASDGSQSAAIYVENAFTGGISTVSKGVSVSNNEISGCQWALYVGNEFDGYAGDVDIVLTATGNNIHDNLDGAVLLTDEDKSAGSSVTAAFTNNTLSSNGSYGYYIYTSGDGAVTANITGGTVTGHAEGLHLEDLAAGASGSAYNVAIQQANLAGNTSWAVQNLYTGTTIAAENNWWGSANGPAHASNTFNVGAQGDAASDDVDFVPWLNAAPPAGVSFAPVTTDTPVGQHSSIQAGVDFATGGTVNVVAGTYSENVSVNKLVSIIGAGSGASDTVVTATGGTNGVFQLSASGLSAAQPVLLKNLRIQPVGKAGISVGQFPQATGTNVSYVELDNVHVIGTNTNPCTEQERGLYVDLTSSLTNLVVKNSAFNNLHYGWYFQKQVSADTSTVQYVTVSNTTFNHNNEKGIYAEKLEDATFTGITVSQNGYDGSLLAGCVYFMPWMSGVDLNLKAGTYQNLTFTDSLVTANGLGGAREGVGLAFKARDDGSTYGPFPATLDNVLFDGGQVTGNERGIRVGEPGKNNAGPTHVVVQDACIFDNIKTYSGTDGSAYGGLVNVSQATAAARLNWWGDASGPYNATSNPAGEGDAVSGDVAFVPWVTGGCEGTALSTILSAGADDALFCTGDTTIVVIDLAGVADLYAYQFEVSYDATKTTATGAFVNSFFDVDGDGAVPGGLGGPWDATCAAGICAFSRTELGDPAVSGSGTLAQIILTGVAPGTFSMAISGDILSDRDGIALSHTLGAPLPMTVCGYATISGFITMQGRPVGNVDTGTVSMIEQTTANFGTLGPATFSATNGAYSISVPYMPGGTSYKIVAEHGLYLDNEDTIAVSASLTNKNTRLWGGDANNSGKVEINDLSCIGGSFGLLPPSTCGGLGGADINADGKVNVQDLAIAGGNYDKLSPQPW